MTDLKKIFIFGPLLLLQTIVFGQDINDPIRVDSLNVFSLKIDSLIKSGLDTFFVYYPYCYSEGYRVPINATEEQLRELECQRSKQSYVFYKLKGNVYVTKVNDCYRFNPIKLNSSPSFAYFTLHYQKLIQDTIRDAAFIDTDGEKYYTGIDHSCYRCFYLSMTKKKYFWIDLYNFNQLLSEKRRNINYSHNIKTHLNKFIDIVFKETENLQFTRKDPMK